MKLPTRADGERLIALRCKSRQGELLSGEDWAFIDRMFKEYSGWYRVTDARVFNETVPPGSDVRMDVRPEAYQYAEDPEP